MIPTSSIKDDADEVISDQPTPSPVLMTACVLKNPKYKLYIKVCFVLHNIGPVRPTAHRKVPASYFQHGKLGNKIPIVKTERGEEEVGSLRTVVSFTEAELLPSSGAGMY